jgi:hypothetical protein
MGVRRPAQLERVIDAGFALSFVLTRVVGYGLGFTHSLRGLWLGYYAPLPPWAYRAMFSLVGMGFALNLAWFRRIVGALQRKALKAGADEAPSNGAAKAE